MQGAFKGGVAVVVSKIGGMFRIGWPTMIGLKGNLREDQLEERGKIWVGFMIKSFENQIGKIEKILNLNGPIKEGDYALGNCVRYRFIQSDTIYANTLERKAADIG